MGTSKPIKNEYIGKDGIKYIFEYYETDSFTHLPKDELQQCYAIAFFRNKFIVVNDSKRYTPVGGGVEADETPEQTMIREIKEESNMEVLKIIPIGYQKVTDTRRIIKPYYQLRYFCLVKPYGPFVKDPDGDIIEIKLISPKDYQKYFDWGEIGEKIMKKAVKLFRKNKTSLSKTF